MWSPPPSSVGGGGGGFWDGRGRRFEKGDEEWRVAGWPPSFKEPRTRSLVEKWKEGRRIGTVLSLSLSFIFFSPTPLTSFAQGEAAANVRFQLHCGGGEFSFLRQKLKYQGQGKDKLSHMTFLMIHQSRAA